MKAPLIIQFVLFANFATALLIPNLQRLKLSDSDGKKVAAKSWPNDITDFKTKVETTGTHTVSIPQSLKIPITFLKLNVPEHIKLILEEEISSALERNLLIKLTASTKESTSSSVSKNDANWLLSRNKRIDPKLLRVVVITAPHHSSANNIPNRFFVFVFNSQSDHTQNRMKMAENGASFYSPEPQSVTRIFVHERSSHAMKELKSFPDERPISLKKILHEDLNPYNNGIALRKPEAEIRYYKKAHLRKNNLAALDDHKDSEAEGELIVKRHTSEFSAMSYALQRVDVGDEQENDTDLEAEQMKSEKLFMDLTEEEAELETLGTEVKNELSSIDDSQESYGEPHGGTTTSGEDKTGSFEEPCVPVTWYTLFHHSVFGTPKLCVQ